MPNPTKTTRPMIVKIFRCVYSDGMMVKDVAEAYNLHLSYVYRLLKAELRKDITMPLLAKYRPSWVKE